MKPVLQLKALSRDERGIGTEGGQVKKKKKSKNKPHYSPLSPNIKLFPTKKVIILEGKR